MSIENFRKQLLADPSLANTNFIVHVIGGNKEAFDELFTLIYDKNGHVANRATWVVEKCAIKYPRLVEPYLNEIVNQLMVTPFDGSKRLLLKIVSLYPLPEKHEGEIIDACLTWLQSPVEKVALKVYAMQVITDFSEKNTAIIPEFLAILENSYELNTMAFKSRANKVITRLRKHI